MKNEERKEDGGNKNKRKDFGNQSYAAPIFVNRKTEQSRAKERQRMGKRSKLNLELYGPEERNRDQAFYENCTQEGKC